MTEVNNSEDIIDSHDVIARIDELEDMLPKSAHEILPGDTDEINELRAELTVLKALAEEAAQYAPNWQYGEALIRDSYFKEYAQQLAEDIGAINADATWPNNCIDWDRAVRELQMDYSSVDFDGVDYWIR